MFCQFVDCQFLIQVFLHKVYGFVHGVAGRFFLYGASVFFQVADGAQKMVKSRACIKQITLAVAQFESMIYFFKQVNTTVDTRVDAWIDVHRRVEASSIGFGKTAFEMYPIDAPRVVFVGAVGMRCVGGSTKHWLLPIVCGS